MGQGGAVGPSQQNVLAGRENLNKIRRNRGRALGRGGGATQNRFLTARQNSLPADVDPELANPGFLVPGISLQSPMSTYRLPGRRRGGRRGGRNLGRGSAAHATLETDIFGPGDGGLRAPRQDMDQYLTDPGFTFPESNFPQSHSDPVAGDPVGTPGSALRGQRMRGIDRSSIAQMQWAMSNLGRITAGETGLRPTWTQQPLGQVPSTYVLSNPNIDDPSHPGFGAGPVGYRDPSFEQPRGGRRRGGRRGGRNNNLPWLSPTPVPLGDSYGNTRWEYGFNGPSAQYLEDPIRSGLGAPMSDYHRRFASNFQPIANPEPVPLPPWGAQWQNRHMDAPYGYIDAFSGGSGPGAGFGNRFGRP